MFIFTKNTSYLRKTVDWNELKCGGVVIFRNNPYISILKLKGSIVDVSIIAVTCAVLGVWDYRAAIAILAGIMIHSGCDIINDIYDIGIDKICKPNGSIASGKISVKNAWLYYVIAIFSRAYSFIQPELCSIHMFLNRNHCRRHYVFTPGFPFEGQTRNFHGWYGSVFRLESIGAWSIFSTINNDSLMVAVYVFVLCILPHIHEGF